MADPEPAWIETAYRSEEAHAEWRIVVGGRVVEHGTVADDSSGERAFETAQARAVAQDLPVAGWKHSVDHLGRILLAPMLFPVRGRTTTDKSLPLRLHGWAKCGDRGREAIAVSPQQLRDLEDGGIPCPVCEEACGVVFQPSPDAKPTALVWNGTRWH
jgi:hypothetical protein